MDIEKLIAGAGNPGNIFDVATDALEELQDELETAAEEGCGMKGLYSKYEVRKRSDGTPVNNCFVLRPDRDDAAIAAMLAYADATSDSQLAKELREWAEFEQRIRCKEDSQ